MTRPGADAGYLADMPWASHYLPLLNPHNTAFAAIASGVQPPHFERICELAFGQGVTLAINAAANQNIMWFGTDLNPGHVAFAETLTSGLLDNLTLSGQPFDQYRPPADFGSFDLVMMTGTWTWIPPVARLAVCCFLEDYLSAEGLFCTDYLTMPGQQDTTSIREMMKVTAGSPEAGKPAGELQAMQILDAIGSILELRPSGLRSQVAAEKLLKSLKQTRPEFIAHEYLNYHWDPLYFAQMCGLMDKAQLSWAGPWSILSHAISLDLTPDQIQYLETIASHEARQATADLLTNRSGREDIWVKHAPSLDAKEREERLRQFQLVLVRDPAEFTFKASGALGEVLLDRTKYGSVLAAMAGHHVVTVDSLIEAIGGVDDFSTSLEMIEILIGLQFIQVSTPDDAGKEAARRPCELLNNRLIELAIDAAQPIGHLASAEIGGGVPVSPAHQCLLKAIAEGAKSSVQMAGFANAHAKILPGSTEPVPANLDAWIACAEKFVQIQLPMLQKLGVAPV